MAKQRTDTESVLKLVINGEQAKTSVKELRESYLKLNAEINNMRKADNPQLYAEKTKQLQRLKEAWDEQRKSISGNTKEVRGFHSSMMELSKGVFGGNMLTRAFDMAVQGAKRFVTQNAELSDTMAGVTKTTGLTEEAVDRLNEKFKKMDTRTANTELLGLAQVAGKLGYTMERDVEGFVRAADKIGVALGEELGGVEESVRSIGKLVDIFKIKDDFGLEEALLKVGSTINELGMAGTASEKTMIDFVQRMAGIAPAAGISIESMLGMAATVDELGQQVESSSTAIGQFIVGMGRDIPKFAKIAGMSVADFSKLLKEDANEAFIRVLEASGSAGGGIQKLAENMGLLGVAGARGVAALGVLADNTDKLRARQQLANDSFRDGTSILEEFNNVNNTLGANLDKIGNKLRTLWENSELRGFFTELTAVLADNRSAMEKAIEEYDRARSTMGTLERETVPLIDRYDELTAKSELTEAEHQELHKIIVKLSDQYPIAVTEMDAYGNAMAINTEIVRGNVEEHRRYLRVVNEKAIAETKEAADAKRRHKERLEMEIRDKRSTQFYGGGGTGGGGGQTVTRDLTNDELKARREELGRLTEELFALDYKLNELGEDTASAFKKYEKAHGAAALDSVEKLTKRIEELTEARKNAVAGSQAYKEAEAGIAILQAKLDAMTAPAGGSGGGGAESKEAKKAREKAEKEAEKHREKAKRDYEKLLADYNALDAARLLDGMSKAQREVAQSEAKYNKLIKQHEDFKKQEGATAEQKAEADEKIRLLEQQRDQASHDIRIRQERDFLAQIEALRDGLAVKHASELDKERQRINKFFDDLERDNAGNSDAIAKLREQRTKALNDAELREKERLERDKAELEAEYAIIGMSNLEKRLFEIEENYKKEVEALEKKYSDELLATKEYHEALELLEKIRNKKKEQAKKEESKKEEITEEDIKEMKIRMAEITADAVFQIFNNNRHAEEDARMEQLRKERESELSNKKLTEAQKKAINDKYDRLEAQEKRKAWQAQKRADLTQAIIATALGVAKSIPNWVQMGIAAAAGAAQVAVIAAQKPPQFARGGLLPMGSSHAQGGIDLWDARRRELVGNIEGGEPILSRATHRNNKAIVDELLYSSMRRNGAKIRLNPDLIDADRAVRNGGSALVRDAKAPAVNVSPPAVDTTAMESIMREVLTAVRESERKPVVISYRLLEDKDERVARIKDGVDA